MPRHRKIVNFTIVYIQYIFFFAYCYKFYNVYRLLVGESLKSQDFKVYSLEDTVVIVGEIKECILRREQVSSS